MSHMKKSWKKDKEEKKISIDVMDKIASRGSFVVVKTDRLYKNLDEEIIPKETTLNEKIADIHFKSWIENIGDNLLDIWRNKTISELPKFKSNTCIVVGRGPSFFEKNHLDLLKQMKNVTIIATEGILKTLLKNGIEPDLVINIDGHRELVLQHYDDEIINNKIKTKSVMSIIVANNIIKRWPHNDDIYFYTPMFDDVDKTISVSNAMSILTHTPVLYTGSNVGIMGINLAYYMGFKNILLTGLDFGYSPDTSIEDSTYYKIVKEADPTITPKKYKELYVIEGYNPDFDVDYYTNIAWKDNIDMVRKQSQTMTKDGIEVINCTESGALHGGAIIGMKLKEAIEKYDKEEN